MITISDVICATASVSGISEVKLTGPSREAAVVYWRHRAMTVARAWTFKSTTQIARSFGRNHSTVVLATQKFRGIQDNDMAAIAAEALRCAEARLSALQKVAA